MPNTNLEDNQYFIYNDNTLIEIDDETLSFITLIPLQTMPEKDWKETEEENEKNYIDSFITPLIKSLNPFEPPRMFGESNLGSTYKVISLYERDSLLQRSLIRDAANSERIQAVGKDVFDNSDDYLSVKKAQKAEAISNYKNYERTDFMVIKTLKSMTSLIEGGERTSESGEITKIEGLQIKKKDRLTHFINYTPEKWEKDRRVIDSIYIEHQNQCAQMENLFADRSVSVRVDNIIEWFSKLSLSTFKTDIQDLNCFKNSVLNYSPEYGSNSVLIRNKAGTAPIRVIDFHPEKVVILNVKKNQHVTYKVNTGEEIDVVPCSENNKYVQIVKRSYLNGHPSQKVLETIECTEGMEITEETPNPTVRSYFLTNLPASIQKNVSMSMASRVLGELAPDSFVQQVEIYQQTQGQQIKYYDKQIFLKNFFLGLFSWLNPGGDLIFNKQLVLDQIEALTAAKKVVGDENLISVRYSFGYKKRVDNDTDEQMMATNLKMLGIEEDNYAEAVQTLDRVMVPWSFNPFILTQQGQSSSLMVPDTRIADFVNLRMGQRPLSFERPKNESDFEPIKKAAFYLKDKDEVQGIDIFRGPEKFNGVIVAPSGSGKSFFAVNMLDGFINANPNNTAWILDRGGSFRRFTDTYGGVNKELTQATKNNSINPFGLNLSMMLLVKLHEYEQYLNETIVDESGFSVKKNELTEEVEEEIRFIVKMMKQISSFNGSTFFYIDDEDTIAEYNRMEPESRKKYDIFKFIVNEDRSVEIATEFFVTQIQDTYAVLSSIILAMLGLKKKDESTAVAFTSITPKVINRLFLNKLEDELKNKSFLYNYNLSDGTPIVEEKVKAILKTTGEGFSENLVSSDTKYQQVKFKSADEVNEYASTNIFFIMEELKEAFSRYIEDHDDLEAAQTTMQIALKELDFYIDGLEAGKLFNVEPPKDMSSETLVNIDLGESQDPRLTTVVPSALLMNFFKVLTAPSKKGSNKILLIDEAHAILGAPDIAGLKAIAYLFRTTRKHNGACWLISQDLVDFHRPNSDRETELSALIKNAGWRILLGSGHRASKEVLGFSGDAVDFAAKSKEGADKYKMVVDMDGKVTNVMELVVSASDYWMSTTHAAEVTVLDILTVMLQCPKKAKLKASQIFPDSGKGMRGKYSTILALQDANPAPTSDEVLAELQETSAIAYTDLQKQRILKDYKTVYALLREAKNAAVSLR